MWRTYPSGFEVHVNLRHVRAFVEDGEGELFVALIKFMSRTTTARGPHNQFAAL